MRLCTLPEGLRAVNEESEDTDFHGLLVEQELACGSMCWDVGQEDTGTQLLPRGIDSRH